MKNTYFKCIQMSCLLLILVGVSCSKDNDLNVDEKPQVEDNALAIDYGTAYNAFTITDESNTTMLSTNSSEIKFYHETNGYGLGAPQQWVKQTSSTYSITFDELLVENNTNVTVFVQVFTTVNNVTLNVIYPGETLNINLAASGVTGAGISYNLTFLCTSPVTGGVETFMSID